MLQLAAFVSPLAAAFSSLATPSPPWTAWAWTQTARRRRHNRRRCPTCPPRRLPHAQLSVSALVRSRVSWAERLWQGRGPGGAPSVPPEHRSVTDGWDRHLGIPYRGAHQRNMIRAPVSTDAPDSTVRAQRLLLSNVHSQPHLLPVTGSLAVTSPQTAFEHPTGAAFSVGASKTPPGSPYVSVSPTA